MTLTFDKPTMAEIEAELADHLRALGYVVERPRDWETPRQFCARLNVTWRVLTAALVDPRSPHVDYHRGKRNRLITIASNKAFEHFLLTRQPTIETKSC